MQRGEGSGAVSAETQAPEIVVYPEQLGSGRTSRVYPGVRRDRAGNVTPVAVKFGGDRGGESLANERMVLEHLHGDYHPNILQHYLGEFDLTNRTASGSENLPPVNERDYLVLERIPMTLKHLLYTDGEFERTCTYREIIRIFLDITSGLAHLHSNNVVHHDLKPSNILIDKEWRAKIGDFGASEIRIKRAVQWRMAGTFGYIAPELFFPKRHGTQLAITDSIDIYSLGAVMLECLTRKHPHDIQNEECPADPLSVIDECCEHHHSSGGETVTKTSSVKVRDTLLENLDEDGAQALIPLPNEFWSLSEEGGGGKDSLSEAGGSSSNRNHADVVEKLQVLKEQEWNEKHGFPWPPELCLLIMECISFEVDDEKDCIARPSASQVEVRLGQMFEKPWIDALLPWVEKGRSWRDLTNGLEPGWCNVCEDAILGKGLCGPVHKGVYLDTHGTVHDVAVKFMSHLDDDDALKVLENITSVYAELAWDTSLAHQNVVHCYGGDASRIDLGTSNMQDIKMAGRDYFLVFEYHPKNLSHLVYHTPEFARRYTYKRLMKLFIDIAQGIAFLHRNQVVHLDLKPTNVLINKAGRVVLSDFGYSKIRRKWSLTHAQRGYMAPEIAYPRLGGARVRIGDTADIFSLGTMMAEGIMRKPPPHDTRNQSGPKELWSLIHECLAVQPDEEQNCVLRPSAENVIDRLSSMLKLPWANDKLPWFSRSGGS